MGVRRRGYECGHLPGFRKMGKRLNKILGEIADSADTRSCREMKSIYEILLQTMCLNSNI